MDYVNIEIRISPDPQEDHYYLVVASTTGRNPKVAQGRFYLSPESWESVEPSLNVLRARDALTPRDHAQKVRGFGRHLFHCLFRDAVRQLYDEKKQEAVRNSKLLRLRLTLVPLDLVVLPWELLFDERHSEYLCLTQHPKTALIRSIDGVKSPGRSNYTPPLRILGMIADPRDLDQLQGERERNTITQALEPLINDNQIILTWIPGKHAEQVNHRLSPERWDVFHFTGHGRFDEQSQQGQLAFENDRNHSSFISAERFRLSLHATTKLVVLNACETARGNRFDRLSNIAHSLASQRIPAVVAMQFKILDTASNQFAKTFYTLLARGYAIDEAVAEARYDIYNSAEEPDRLDWAAPILYISSSNVLSFQPVQIQNRPPDPPPPLPIKPIPPDDGEIRSVPPEPIPGKPSWRNRVIQPIQQWKTLPRWAKIVSAAILVVFLLTGGALAIPRPLSTSLCVATNLPTTGLLSTIGHDIQNGVDLAYNQSPFFNKPYGSGGYHLKIVHMDDDSGQQGGIRNASQANANLNLQLQQTDCTLVAVIGPYDSLVAIGEIPVAIQNHLLLLSPSNTVICLTKPESFSDPPVCNFNTIHPPGSQNTYARLPFTDEDQGLTIAHFLVDPSNPKNPEQGGLGKKNIEIVGDEEIYGTELSVIVKNYLQQQGVTPSMDCVKLPDEYSRNTSCSLNSGTKAYSTSTQSLMALAQKIQAAQPDAILFAGRNDRGAGLLRQQLAKVGYKGPFIGGSALVTDTNQFFRDIGFQAANVYAVFPGADLPTSTLGTAVTFVKEYQKRFSKAPRAYSGNGYDAANIILQTIKYLIDTGQPVTRESVRQAVFSNSISFTGVAGNSISFDPNGDNTGQQVFTIYQSQQESSSGWDWKVLQEKR